MMTGPRNALFAWQPVRNARPADSVANPFADTSRVTLPGDAGESPGVEVAAGPNAVLHRCADFAAGWAAYLWGIASHPRCQGDSLLRWCVDVIRAGYVDELAELNGLFVLIVDDRRSQRVHLVADALGVRPWFVARTPRLVCGSSVWPMRRAGLISPRLDPDAIAGWVWYGYDCNGGSLFADARRLRAGAVTTIDLGVSPDSDVTERLYVMPTGGNARPAQADMADLIHHRLSESFLSLSHALMSRGHDRISLALTGGYDSRVLAALTAKAGGPEAEAFYVRESAAEEAVAMAVAKSLKLPFRVIPTDGSQWNAFGTEPYHCLPSGFPITKQVSHLVAEQRPGTPVINGFLGDILVRSTGDPRDRDLETEPDETLTPRLTRRRRLAAARVDLLHDRVAARIEERAREAMRAMVVPGIAVGKPFVFSGLYGRQRCYTSNNFLAHLDLAEPILPFHTWPLIALRYGYDYDCFTWETYDLLFRRHYPELAGFPHPHREPAASAAVRPPPSRCTRGWAAEVLSLLARPGVLPIVVRRKAIPRMIGALLGNRDVDPAVGFLHRLSLLHRWCNEADVPLDWNAV